jgi:serine/arginine repetitive matrix protein 2
MYNGVGISTPRGTGTCGHVAANLGRAPRPKVQNASWKTSTKEALPMTKPDAEILDYERKRQIELLVLKWAENEDLLDSEYVICSLFKSLSHIVSIPEEIIQEKMDEARIRIEKEFDERKNKKPNNRLDDNASTHQRAKLKEQELSGFANALKIDNYREGDAFDEKVQQAKKQARMQERLEKEELKLKVCSL